VHEVDVEVHVKPPGVEVTVYKSTRVAPPKSLGAVQETVTDLFPGATEVIKGCVGLLAAIVIVT
jgi:hypothetical protein